MESIYKTYIIAKEMKETQGLARCRVSAISLQKEISPRGANRLIQFIEHAGC